MKAATSQSAIVRQLVEAVSVLEVNMVNTERPRPNQSRNLTECHCKTVS